MLKSFVVIDELLGADEVVNETALVILSTAMVTFLEVGTADFVINGSLAV